MSTEHTARTEPAKRLTLPEPSLVVLVGASGAGKSTFARRHFRPSEIVSSDWARGAVCDDENSLEVNQDAFELVHFLIGKRLANLRLCVVDATNVQAEARASLVQLARDHHLFPVAIVLDLPEAECVARNAERPDRQDMGRHVVRNHVRSLRRSLKSLRREGFRYVHVLDSVAAVDAVTIERAPLFTDRRSELGPFDLVGDVHGCHDELLELLDALGYRVEESPDPAARFVAPHYGLRVTAPPGRRLCFVGDLVDRGPRTPDVLRLAMSAVADGVALAVPGNHDVKLARALRGERVKLAHGLAESLEQLEAAPASFREAVVAFVDGLVSHLVLDEGRLCVAHAGMKAAYQRRSSGRVREFALYGETTGESDEFGLPVRLDWAAEYRGKTAVVYGHTPVLEAEWLNDTLCIDTGCVFGGQLTALRWPERELVAVDAHETWCEPLRPLADSADPRSAQQAADDVLDLADVSGKRQITTRYRQRVAVRPEHATAALEVMSRFAVDPRWLVYLPPTMSPCETSAEPGLLEHPAEAFAYFRAQGLDEVVCEQKHMGSRAVLVLVRDEAAARRRFGESAESGRTGVIYTRTGRPFFGSDTARETALLERVHAAATASGLWDELAADWLLLDCELMPWNEKARQLLREQYAPVATAARGALEHALAVLEQTEARGVDCTALRAQIATRLDDAQAFARAWQPYCWPVSGLDDLRLAPFHLLAAGDRVLTDRDHLWHMQTLARLAEADPTGVLMATAHRHVDLNDAASCEAAIQWWQALVEAGGEGMVVKPRSYLAQGKRGLVQPAVKVRGPEYLRIIYGPGYREPHNLERLRRRGLGRKRSLALRELALGLEALERFVARRPLREVHECVFAVLALESEPIDPRL